MKDIIEKIKKNVLIKRTSTIIFIAILVALFIGLTLCLNSLELDPIDFTTDKLYTLTDTSKERVKNIQQEVNIYFVGYLDESETIDLAKQYHNANEKINIETVTANDRPDLVAKYNISQDSQGVIVESGEKSKVLTAEDFYTYDPTTYQSIDITEEKLTNAILYVVSEKIPKVYFLEGYSSNFALSKSMTYFSAYLENEVMEFETLNPVTTGKIPEDCDTLIITTPDIDFDEMTLEAITNYINNGGNILWFNAIVAQEQNLTNVNKVLAMYGVKPFEMGYINETDAKKMMSEAPYVIFPTINYSKITKNITLVMMIDATKINFVTDEELNNLKVTKTDLLQTSEGAFFRTNFDITSNNKVDGEEEGTFIVGAELDKVVAESTDEAKEKVSKLVIYGDNGFISDYAPMQGAQTPMLFYYHNKNLAIDSILYLVDRQEDITIRKDTNVSNYTATVEQDTIIKAIVFGVPGVIIAIGIMVWQVRRRKK